MILTRPLIKTALSALAALAFFSAPIAFCQAPLVPAAPPPVVASGITILADAQVKTTAVNTAQAEVGPVDPVASPTVEQVFRLKNTAAQPITLSRLRASCGCETLLLSKGGASVPTAILAPGEQAEVRIIVKLAGQRSGLLHKYAWVYGPKGEPPLVNLEMAITIHEAVSFSSNFLDFGSIASKTTHVLPLTVTVEKRLVPEAGLPPLSSSSADVQVSARGGVIPVTQDGKPAVQQAYEVRLLAPLNSGRLAGDLRFQTTDALSPSFRTAFVPIGGNVIGSLSASPKTVFLGSISANQSVTRQVLLSVAAKDAGKLLTVSSTSPWIQAQLAPPAEGSSGPRLLSVSLKPGGPPGSLQAQIAVVSETGEHLQIPVIVEIVRAAKKP